MKDKELQLKIIEINRARNRLILSERLAVQEWRQRRREELLDELKPGEVRLGVVSNLANFGAFVDLGGADGLVHISQLALALSLQRADELDAPPVPAELSPIGPPSGAESTTAPVAPTSPLEELPSRQEPLPPTPATPSLETASTGGTPRRSEGRAERQRRETEKPLLSSLPLSDRGETRP